MLNEFKQKYAIKDLPKKPEKKVEDLDTYEEFNKRIKGVAEKEENNTTGKKDITPKYNENR